MKHLFKSMLVITAAFCYSATSASDLSELREVSKASEGHGPKSLSGLTCTAKMTIRNQKGDKTNDSFCSMGNFRSETTWALYEGKKHGDWEAAIVQNKDLSFTIAYPGKANSKMPDYQFGPPISNEWLAGSSFFPSLTAGSRFRGETFSYIAQQDGFAAERAPNEDTDVFGKCWRWGFDDTAEYPPYRGKIWFRTFPSKGTVAISKLTFAIGDGETTTFEHKFSDNPVYEDLIEQISIVEPYGQKLFEITDIEEESAPDEAYTPEYFGFAAPVNPKWKRIYLWIAAVGTGLVGVFLTVRGLRRSR